MGPEVATSGISISGVSSHKSVPKGGSLLRASRYNHGIALLGR